MRQFSFFFYIPKSLFRLSMTIYGQDREALKETLLFFEDKLIFIVLKGKIRVHCSNRCCSELLRWELNPHLI